jgi:predicted nucleic acid-binding protein
MPTVLVDTAAWIALVNTRDELHDRAIQIMAELRDGNVTLVTTEFVLIEVANAFCTSAWRMKAIKLIEGLRSLPNLRIIEADSSLLSDGWQLYCDRLDEEWSLTDCEYCCDGKRPDQRGVHLRSSFRASGFRQIVVKAHSIRPSILHLPKRSQQSM